MTDPAKLAADVLDIYEDACLVYARNRNNAEPLGCDRFAMAATFKFLARKILELQLGRPIPTPTPQPAAYAAAPPR